MIKSVRKVKNHRYICVMATTVLWQTYWQAAQSFWQYYWRAQTRYDVHSPFLAAWIEATLEDQRQYYIFQLLKGIRTYWEQSPVKVELSTDFGAGSRSGQGRQRTARQMAKYNGVDRFTGELLFRTALYLKPGHILELGTSLGFSAAYIRSACRSANFISIEGHREVARLAQETIRRLPIPKIDQRVGNFKDVLPEILKDLGQLDFAWLDGDHRGNATEGYIQQMLPYVHKGSLLAIGDIHWSKDMEAAWERLKKTEGVSATVDLYHLGLLFFNEDIKETQHYTLIPARFKPWRMGFWR